LLLVPRPVDNIETFDPVPSPAFERRPGVGVPPCVIVTQEFMVFAMQSLKTAKPVVFGFSGNPVDGKLRAHDGQEKIERKQPRPQRPIRSAVMPSLSGRNLTRRHAFSAPRRADLLS
jgi:hypothetical protein